MTRIQPGMAIEFLFYGSHEETREHLSAYAEGELRGYRRWRVARHLAKCDMCAGLYRNLLAAVGNLRRLGRSEPPENPELADSVVRRIREDEAGPSP